MDRGTAIRIVLVEAWTRYLGPTVAEERARNAAQNVLFAHEQPDPIAHIMKVMSRTLSDARLPHNGGISLTLMDIAAATYDGAVALVALDASTYNGSV